MRPRIRLKLFKEQNQGSRESGSQKEKIPFPSEFFLIWALSPFLTNYKSLSFFLVLEKSYRKKKIFSFLFKKVVSL